MKFEACEMVEAKVRQRRRDNYTLLEEFRDSGLACARVVEYTTAKARYCATSLRASIKHYQMTNIEVYYRNNEVYLVNTLKT